MKRILAFAALATSLAGCGGGGGSGSPAPAPSPTTTPAVADVLFAPYPDQVSMLSFPSQSIQSTIAAPAGSTFLGNLAVDTTGTILYATATSPSGQSLAAFQVTAQSSTLVGSTGVTTTTGKTALVPLSNGSVLAFTVAPGSSRQALTEYSATLASVEQSTSVTSSFSSPVTGPNSSFIAVDATGYIDEVTFPSLTVVASTRGNGFATISPIAVDANNGIVYATLFDPTANATTLYSIPEATFAATAIARVPGNGSVYAAADGIAVVDVGATASRIYVVNATTQAVVPIDLSAQPGTLASVALRESGATVVAAVNNNGSGNLTFFDARTGLQIAAFSRNQPVIGPMVTR